MATKSSKQKLKKKIIACSAFGAAVVVCFWWAYSLFTGSSDCGPSGTQLGLLVAPLCAAFGNKAVAAIPMLGAVVSAVMFVSEAREKI